MLPGYPAGVAATSPPYPTLSGQPPRSTRPAKPPSAPESCRSSREGLCGRSLLRFRLQVRPCCAFRTATAAVRSAALGATGGAVAARGGGVQRKSQFFNAIRKDWTIILFFFFLMLFHATRKIGALI